MSTELFRQYLDLLNEAVTQSDLDNQLLPALKELERILGKYRGKIYEADLEDPPLFGPEEPRSPSGPKPRLKMLPGESREQFLQRVRNTAGAAQRLGIRPGTAPTPAAETPPSPSGRSPSLDTGRVSGYTPEPEPSAISRAASKVLDATKAGASAAVNIAKQIPLKKTMAALAAGGYAAYELWQWITRNSGYALRDLDPVDQASVKKNLKILEPFVVPDVFKTLPADIQTRIGTVLDQLKKLGMSAGGDQAAPQPVAAPATPASAAAPAGEESFTDTLQNAYRYVKSVRESVEPVGLSEAEKMARLRDLVQENLPLMAVGAEVGSRFVQDVIDSAEYLGLAALIKKSPNIYLGLEALIKRFKTDVPAGTPKDFWKWLGKLVIPSKAEAVALGIGAAGWMLYQWFQVNATVAAKDAAVNALTKDWPAENNALKAFKDRMVRMTQAEYDARSNDDKDKIDETWIYYCSKFPSDKVGNQTCYDYVHNPKNGICTYHPDWAACKKPSTTP
jgi:hypothetical protein